MENKIYQVLRKHRLPLKKREELMPDLLALFIVGNSKADVCPECGYPKFKKTFEDFERCHGCNWTSEGI